MGNHKVFVYGTLMRERTCTAVMGRYPEHEPADLVGYERGMVGGAHFPGIRPKEGKQVRGWLLKGVTDDELGLLDRYEGEGTLYLRKQVTVYVVDKEAHDEDVYALEDCFVYVFHPDRQHQINTEVDFIL